MTTYVHKIIATLTAQGCDIVLKRAIIKFFLCGNNRLYRRSCSPYEREKSVQLWWKQQI